ncbi:MAG: glycoside hydrolase family 2 [Dysgonamonadaceae bacterium]|jgi:hypothetical protein|nr:glycoside hydrolase family 2 [Dysgonamonadaceae bacterium]
MKTKIFFLVSMLSATILLPVACQKSSFENNFVNPPKDVRIGVYWYWIYDNISKQGVIADLNAMKKAGITRAFIGNIGSETNFPKGDVKIFTDEWWDILHTALKTAGELDIEIGMFNCPGWSQSGGPWIKSEQSMRYLASADTSVTGPATFTGTLLPTMIGEPQNFQDVKVLAFPSNKAITPIRKIEMTKVVSPAQTRESVERARFDAVFTILLNGQQTSNSFIFRPTEYVNTKAEIQYLDIDGEYKTIKEFTVDRSNPRLQVGFEPYAPIVIGLPEITTTAFRFILKNVSQVPCYTDLYVTHQPVIERYPEKTLAKMFQSTLPLWHDYMWDTETSETALSIPLDKVLDISDKLNDGVITWEVPEGEWTIMRTGMTTTGVTNGPASKEGTGLEVDKMNYEHAQYHFDNFIGKILERIPASDRKSLKVVVADSYEMGGQNFTDGFLEEFRAKYGYDAVPFLPVLQGFSIGSPDISDRFLWDLRRLVADKVAYCYVAGLRDASKKHGLTVWLENYGHWGFPGEFLQYGGQSDEIGGEFWADGDLGSIECRAASSCAHIYGKKTVSCESFTSGADWGRNPTSLKRRGDWSFTEGINKTILHVYIQQPYEDIYPGIDAWFGTEFNRKNTWFSHIDLFIDYLRRCNYMLQQGQNVADVAYFIGEDVPKMTGVRNPELPKGYSFDYINAEIIIRDLTVKNGMLTLPHGTTYRMLVLPPQETMRPELLEKIGQLVADGAIVAGNPPTRSPSLQDYPAADEKVSELAAKIWGDGTAKGNVFANTSLEDIFTQLGIVPDCEIDTVTPVLYAHRSMEGAEIYFLTNQSTETIEFNPKFRLTGLKPELWDAITGSVRPLPAFEQTGKTTTVPVRLLPQESAFIVFKEKGKPTGELSATSIQDNFPAEETIAEFTTSWTVSFNSDEIHRGPARPVTFETLTDWTQNADSAIKYYSGAAVYKNTFTVSNLHRFKSSNLFLDLEKVAQMAKVKINGKDAGGVWTYPYRIDISQFVKDGENTVEVEVVNTWKNRIIGENNLPEKERRVVPASARVRPGKPMIESGIIGTPKVVAVKYK